MLDGLLDVKDKMSTTQRKEEASVKARQLFRLKLSAILSDGANIAVIMGVIFAILQITMTTKTEKVRLAIEAAMPTQSKDFLESYSKLLESYRADKYMIDCDSLRDDLLFVMNVYDSIAVQYLNGLLENEIVEKRLCDGMISIVPVLDAMKWPPENRVHFNDALKRMRARTQ